MYVPLIDFLLDHRIFVCVHEKVLNTYAVVENNSINKTIYLRLCYERGGMGNKRCIFTGSG